MKQLQLILAVVIAALGFATVGFSQEPGKKPEAKYVPVLPAVKARMLPVDPQKGYLVKEVKPGVFVITDGGYQSAFVTTGQAVILFDAPPSSPSVFGRFNVLSLE